MSPLHGAQNFRNSSCKNIGSYVPQLNVLNNYFIIIKTFLLIYDNTTFLLNNNNIIFFYLFSFQKGYIDQFAVIFYSFDKS